MEKKSLVKVNENGIFRKISHFFRSLFYKNKNMENVNIIKNSINCELEKENSNNHFMEYIKNIENEETKLLNLQKQYRSGEIKEEDLTKEQVNSLCFLYDNQIANLKKSNKIRKERLLEYRKALQINN